MKNKTVAKLMTTCLCVVFLLILASGCAAKEPTDKPDKTTAPQSAESVVKVAGIYSGQVNDMSWNTNGYRGLQRIEKMGAEISYQENVKPTSSVDSLYTYGSEGYDVIFVNSNSHQQNVLEVAPDFPNQDFVILSGDYCGENIYSVQLADEQHGFMMGVIAALATKDNKVAFVQGSQQTPQIHGYQGFIAGVKYIDPSIEILHSIITVTNNVNEGKESAIALIDSGADVVASIADNASLGVLEACEQRNVWGVAPSNELCSVAPNIAITGITKDSALVYEAFYKQWLDNNKPTEVKRYGADVGVITMGDWGKAADDALTNEEKQRILDIYDLMKNNEIDIEYGYDMNF